MTTSLIRLLSANGNVAVGEVDGMRERNAGEMVHYKKKTEELCNLCDCSKPGIVWIDSIDRWKRNTFRCIGSTLSNQVANR